MAFVSITRLKVRSGRFLIPFLLATWRSRRQLRRAPGFKEGRLTIEWPPAFWTMTVWADLEMMRQFRNAAPHKDAMVKLLDWCGEAAYTHWEQPNETMPSEDVAFNRLRDEGRTSKVRHPTPAHLSGKTVSDRKPRPSATFGAA